MWHSNNTIFGCEGGGLRREVQPKEHDPERGERARPARHHHRHLRVRPHELY